VCFFLARTRLARRAAACRAPLAGARGTLRPNGLPWRALSGAARPSWRRSSPFFAFGARSPVSLSAAPLPLQHTRAGRMHAPLY
jgi:hypothetical protein